MANKSNLKALELLAPARDAATAIIAIDHGADAVYIGAPAHGARATAANSIDDIRRVCEYAHRFCARVYVTVNTILKDDELEDVRRMIYDLYDAGVDALIVQDMALLRMELPPIALHASTQCDTRVPEKARFLQDVGFSQIVLARELTLEEIRQVSDVVDVPLEVFVHGALCVSYSGDCQMSFVDNGRSANRGECAQMCRLSYDLADGNGKIVQSHRHLLSLRDMNRIEMLGSLAEAGVASFKIEGRLKDEAYVKNVTAAYSRALDKFIAANPEKYRRASQGRIEIDFTPALEKSFNRGFTDYFLNGPRPSGNMANIHTPKDAGTEIGEIKSRRGSGYEVVLRRGIELHNGDGLCFVNADGRLQGFRLNRVAGNCIYPAGNPGIFPGMKLRRNSDAAWEVAMRGKTSRRVIDCDARIWLTADRRLALRLSDDYGISATVTTDNVPELPSARNSDTSARRNAVGKLGDSIYMLRDFDDRISESVFVPSSLLSNLRRKCVELFNQSRLLSRRPDLRVNPVRDAEYKRTLTYHDNVANHLSHEFYASHGADVKQYALEAKSGLSQNELRVMTCRYCIRRELGVCLREGGEHKLHGPLYLLRGNRRWRLDFDCKACRMQVVACGQSFD